ncbi:MAG: hypothetical protein ACOX2L_00750 [Anaerolineae bacterium]|nr:hypothetical protein [Chloroflexota bacterium]
MLEMARAWGRDHDQDAMALLLPNAEGTGGRLIWDLGRRLKDEELDTLLAAVGSVNRELAGQVAQEHDLEEITLGPTVRDDRLVGLWVPGMAERIAGGRLFSEAIRRAQMGGASERYESGCVFQLLFKDRDYWRKPSWMRDSVGGRRGGGLVLGLYSVIVCEQLGKESLNVAVAENIGHGSHDGLKPGCVILEPTRELFVTHGHRLAQSGWRIKGVWCKSGARRPWRRCGGR